MFCAGGLQAETEDMAPGDQRSGGSLSSVQPPPRAAQPPPRAAPATSAAATDTTDSKLKNLALRRQRKKEKEKERKHRRKLANKDEAAAAAAAAAAKAKMAVAAAAGARAVTMEAAAAAAVEASAASDLRRTEKRAPGTDSGQETEMVEPNHSYNIYTMDETVVAAAEASATVAAPATSAASESEGETEGAPEKGSSDQTEMAAAQQCQKIEPRDETVAAAAAAAVETSGASESGGMSAGEASKDSKVQMAIAETTRGSKLVCKDEKVALALAATAAAVSGKTEEDVSAVVESRRDKPVAVTLGGEIAAGSAETASICEVEEQGAVVTSETEPEGTIATEEAEKVSTCQSAVLDKEAAVPKVHPALRFPLPRQHLARSSKALLSPATSELLLPEAQELWAASYGSSKGGWKKARISSTEMREFWKYIFT